MKIKRSENNTFFEYGLCFTIGLFLGVNLLPDDFVGIVYVLLGVVCLYYAAKNNVQTVLCILAYMVYSERYIKNKSPIVPFLFMQYFIIALFFILLLSQKRQTLKMHSRAYVLLILFCVIDFLDSLRSSDALTARSIFINTLSITVVATWASFNFLTPKMMNKILNHVKLASVFLCGIIMARKFFGPQVSYELTSMSESLNGLSAVQMSGYLGVAASIFFFSLVDEKEKKQFWLNLVFLILVAIQMILSFSRGGIYFLGIIMAVFFAFNWNKVKSYSLLLLFVPVSFGVYNYVTETTHGLVEERFGEEGNSGRTDLVKAAFELFISNPLVGVGTANFADEISKNDLYGQESGSHNEFARAAAEHGILGIITFWGFFITIFFEILGRSKNQREYALYFLILFCLIIVHNGLKISVQPYILIFVIATPTLITIKKKQLDVYAPQELKTGG